MANVTSPLLPNTEGLLKEFGERLRLARLRRRLQAKQVAERAGMTEVTLRRVERGMPGVTIGAYLAVMQVLQLQEDVKKWAIDDPVGRQLQDAETHGGMRPRRITRALKVEPAQLKVTEGKANFTVRNASSSPEVIRNEQPSGAIKGVSSSDLLQAITLPPQKPTSPKSK